MLSGILRLNEAQLGAVYALNRRLGRQWLGSFLDDAWVERFVNGDEPGRGEKLAGLDGLAKALGQHPATLAALRTSTSVKDAPWFKGQARMLR